MKKSRISKVIAVLAVALMIIIGFTACSGGKSKEKVISSIEHYAITNAQAYCMTDEAKDYYKMAVDAVFDRKSSVKLSSSYDTNLMVYGALKDSPYAIFLKEFDIDSSHTGMYFKYEYSEDEQKEMIEFIDNEYLDLINECISADMSELEKILAIYKYFGNRITYDGEYEADLKAAKDKVNYPEISLYEGLKTGKGVCHTYTYLCEFAFQQLGIESWRVTGYMTYEPDVRHIWLIVKIGDNYYHIDPTWDDLGDEEVGLRNFGMTDKECEDRGIKMEDKEISDAYAGILCNDERFNNLRDFVDYELLGNGKMKVTAEDGVTKDIDLSDYE